MAKHDSGFRGSIGGDKKGQQPKKTAASIDAQKTSRKDLQKQFAAKLKKK